MKKKKLSIEVIIKLSKYAKIFKIAKLKKIWSL